MASIINNEFRLANLKALIAQLADTTNNAFYMCLGKPLVWSDEANPDTPRDSQEKIRAFWDNAIAGKRITDTNARQGILLRPWISGQYYDMYRHDWDGTVASKNLDGTTRSINAPTLFDTYYFVVNTANGNVYKCLYNRSHTTNLQVASTDASFLTDTSSSVVHGTDGYDWKYMFTIDTGDDALFATPSFKPASNTSVAALVNGGIYSILVTTAGAYSVAPTVTIHGDGSGATATAHIAGGGVVWVEVTAPGSGYTHASVVFSGGTGAGGTVAKAMISPKGGHGSAPADELGGIYLILQQKFVADESSSGSKFTIGNDFRQIALIKNPTKTSVLVTLDAVLMSHALVLTTNPGAFAADSTLTGVTSGAKGQVIDYTAASKTIRFNYDYTITTVALGVPFQVAETVGNGTFSGVVATSGVVSPDIDPYTGFTLYYENRVAITRSSSQTEDCRVIVEL